MGSFTIAYVPTVEEVLKVEQVDRVQLVDTVGTVNDVRKLPHPYFPLKQLNFQTGGQIHITPATGMYQAVYIPNKEIEFKGIHLCLTSYNIEDTYDVRMRSPVRFWLRAPVKALKYCNSIFQGFFDFCYLI